MDFGLETIWVDYAAPEVVPLFLVFFLQFFFLIRSFIIRRRIIAGNASYSNRTSRNARVLLLGSVVIASGLLLSLAYRYLTYVRPDMKAYYLEHPNGHFHHNLFFLDHFSSWGVMVFLAWGVPFIAMLNWKRIDALAQQITQPDAFSGSR
jgi:hypothetical protein